MRTFTKAKLKTVCQPLKHMPYTNCHKNFGSSARRVAKKKQLSSAELNHQTVIQHLATSFILQIKTQINTPFLYFLPDSVVMIERHCLWLQNFSHPKWSPAHLRGNWL